MKTIIQILCLVTIANVGFARSLKGPPSSWKSGAEKISALKADSAPPSDAEKAWMATNLGAGLLLVWTYLGSGIYSDQLAAAAAEVAAAE